VATVDTVTGDWGEGVGVQVGEVSDSGKVAGGGDVTEVADSGVVVSSPLSALGGGCTLIPHNP